MVLSKIYFVNTFLGEKLVDALSSKRVIKGAKQIVIFPMLSEKSRGPNLSKG
jgi:hypothetical protein